MNTGEVVRWRAKLRGVKRERGEVMRKGERVLILMGNRQGEDGRMRLNGTRRKRRKRVEFKRKKKDWG